MAEELVEGISLMGELSGVDSNDVLDVLGAEIGMKFPVFLEHIEILKVGYL